NELMRLELIKTELVPSNKQLNLKILVVEDYEINRILISELLDQYDVEYEFAFNGQEAINKLKRKSYDLILMDINMPVMNGIEATKVIKDELKISTPIIALTANALEGDRETFLSAGMDDYLSKPINVKSFENLLTRYHNSGLEGTKQIVLDIDKSLAKAAKNMNFPENIINKLFTSYVESLADLETNIRNSIESKDFDTLKMNAHNLKSGAASLCFDPIVELAQKLESKSNAKDELYDYEEKFKKVKAYLDLLKAAKEDK
ncbi:MAG: response regulator, partial [Campylobacterota bacterium]